MAYYRSPESQNYALIIFKDFLILSVSNILLKVLDWSHDYENYVFTLVNDLTEIFGW